MESGAMGVNTQKNPLVLYTDVQTQGKGQRGNTWISEAGKNAMFTVAFPLMPGYENQLVLMNKGLSAGPLILIHSTPKKSLWLWFMACGMLGINWENLLRNTQIGFIGRNKTSS